MRSVQVVSPEGPSGVRVTDAPEPYIRAQLKGIVGLRLPITRIEGKRKLSQNQPQANRDGVATGLAAGPRESDRIVSGMIPREPKA